MDVFVMDPESGKARLAHPEDCWECSRFFCQRECPTGAIEVTTIAVRPLHTPY